MEIVIDALALENWYDLLAFLSRPHLGQLAAGIGNRRLAKILQGFLHKYLQEITLPSINVSKTNNEDANDFPNARINLWHSDKWGTEELPLADWPMPENITNFESIKLSYLDVSVLRFLQKFQLNSLFTNVHLHFHTWNYNSKLAGVAQIFSHVLPLVSSIDSIVLDGSDLLAVGCGCCGTIELPPTLSTFGLPDCKTKNSPLVTTILNMTRLLEILSTFGDRNFSEIYWLCKWLYNPRADQKARVLMLFQGAGYYHAFFLERLKEDFLEAKEAVSFFVGIQIGFFENSDMPIPAEGSTMLTNSHTHERMSITVRKIEPWQQFRGSDYGPAFMLISRHPLHAAQEWIDASEKEILEYKRRKLALLRKIELNGSRIGIFPVENSPPPTPAPPNLFRKTFLTLKRMWK